jgi:predicted glutamine amidotransferase
MCRIFLSFDRPDNKTLLENFIKQAHPSYRKNTPRLLKNPRDNGPHTDGAGFAVLRRGKWVVYKSIENDADSRLPRGGLPTGFLPTGFLPTERELTIGHIRKKCPDYPGHISIENTHPFSYRNHIMLHNGFLHDIDVHSTKYKGWVAPDLRKYIKGETDSEILFFIYLTYMRKHKSNQDKNGGFYMIETLREVLAKFIKEGHEVSANLIVSDGHFVLITRYLWTKKHKTPQHALSLYYDVCDGIVISSEPVTEDYRVVPENTALLIDIKAETMMGYPIFI